MTFYKWGATGILSWLLFSLWLSLVPEMIVSMASIIFTWYLDDGLIVCQVLGVLNHALELLRSNSAKIGQQLNITKRDLIIPPPVAEWLNILPQQDKFLLAQSLRAKTLSFWAPKFGVTVSRPHTLNKYATKWRFSVPDSLNLVTP
jgi:hypothetical protein